MWENWSAKWSNARQASAVLMGFEARMVVVEVVVWVVEMSLVVAGFQLLASFPTGPGKTGGGKLAESRHDRLTEAPHLPGTTGRLRLAVLALASTRDVIDRTPR